MPGTRLKRSTTSNGVPVNGYSVTWAMVIGEVNVWPPSVEMATTCRLGSLVESAFSVQKASTVPLEETAICPVSRKPCAVLLLAALTCTALDHVRPSSSEWATKSLTLPLPEQVLQKSAQLR